MVLEALMDQGLTEPKYLGLVQQPNKKLMGIPRDISGLRLASGGQGVNELLQGVYWAHEIRDRRIGQTYLDPRQFLYYYLQQIAS